MNLINVKKMTIMISRLVFKLFLQLYDYFRGKYDFQKSTLKNYVRQVNENDTFFPSGMAQSLNSYDGERIVSRFLKSSVNSTINAKNFDEISVDELKQTLTEQSIDLFEDLTLFDHQEECGYEKIVRDENVSLMIFKARKTSDGKIKGLLITFFNDTFLSSQDIYAILLINRCFGYQVDDNGQVRFGFVC